MTMNPRQVASVGRLHVYEQLARDGVEFAIPYRGRGIHVIGYDDAPSDGGRFRACPIKVRASSERAFGLYGNYAEWPGLIIAYVWNVSGSRPKEIYLLSYQEALEVADSLGLTETDSWAEKGNFVCTDLSEDILEALAPYRVAPGEWHRRLFPEQDELSDDE